MHTNIVLTLSGTDRVGIVEEVTEALLELGANVETSRMARLGGEFAMLMLVSLPEERGDVDGALRHLADQGYRVGVTRTESDAAQAYAGWLPYRIEVQGADHEGIVHEIAAGLAHQGINIESMDTSTTPAPLSGTPLFSMTALVAVPPRLAETDWITELADVGHRSNVDITVSVAER